MLYKKWKIGFSADISDENGRTLDTINPVHSILVPRASSMDNINNQPVSLCWKSQTSLRM